MQLGAITADWISQNLYSAVLGQPGDAEGIAYWTQEAEKQGWTADQLANVWMDSAKTVLTQSTAEMRAELAPAIFDPPAPVLPQQQPVRTATTTQLPVVQQQTMPPVLTQNLVPTSRNTMAAPATDNSKTMLLIGAAVLAAVVLMKKKKAH